MKVAYLIGGIYNGGQERQLLLLCNELKGKVNCDVLVWNITDADKLMHNNFIESDIRLIEIPKGSYILKIRYLINFIKANKYEIIHSYSFYLNFIVVILGLFTKIKGIGGIRNELKQCKIDGKFLFFISTFFNRNLVSNNQKAIDEIKKIWWMNTFWSNVFLIRNGVSIQKTNNELNVSKKIDIISIGRFARQKRWDLFFNVIYELKKIRPFISVNIYGSGPLKKELLNLIKKLNMENNIQLCDPVKNVSEVLKNGRIFMLTSEAEGMANVIVEAMLNGLPVVCTNAGDNSYLIKEGVNGFVFEINDYINMVDCIDLLLNDEKNRCKIGKNNIRKATDCYSPEIYSKSILLLYKNLLNNK